VNFDNVDVGSLRLGFNGDIGFIAEDGAVYYEMQAAGLRVYSNRYMVYQDKHMFELSFADGVVKIVADEGGYGEVDPSTLKIKFGDIEDVVAELKKVSAVPSIMPKYKFVTPYITDDGYIQPTCFATNVVKLAKTDSVIEEGGYWLGGFEFTDRNRVDADTVRDFILVIDATEFTEDLEVHFTWGGNNNYEDDNRTVDLHFHPRTDAEMDFACEAGKRNVYWITEYAPNEFCVAGWQETTGGNAS
jgi:hypothetical protein